MRHQRWLILAVIPAILGAAAPGPVIPAAGDPAAVEADFRRSAAMSRGSRSGDIYTLVNPYNYVVEDEYARPETAHFKQPGHPAVVRHRGTSHGNMWHYDTRIPLILYGPGRVKAGYRPTADATQQDLPATYAWLLGTTPPRDCRGRALQDAFTVTTAPKAILTILVDQGGRNLYARHPDAWPNLKRLQGAGTDFVNARVAHLEAETALGHIAVGTGAYPDRTGVPSNYFYHPGHGHQTYSFTADKKHSPVFLESPTLGDTWLRATQSKALVMGLCYSDRAVMGMVGHGSYYEGNAKSIAVYYDEKTGHLATNEDYFRFPGYLSGLNAKTYWDRLTNGTGKWFDHDIGTPANVRRTPALVNLDGDAFVQMIEQEAVGADDVTDLLYLTLKSTDAAGHQYGYESEEVAAVLTEADRQIGRVVAALEAKVGKGNVVVAVSADHGGTPLVEFSGGSRLIDDDVIGAINKRFMAAPQGGAIALFATGTQIWLDDNALRRHGATRAQVVAFLKAFKVDGKPFYRLVLDSSEVEAERARLYGWGSSPVRPAGH